MNELISIIIPVYNSEQYLSECIDSVLGQTYTSIELILVDDGSTDTSGALCDHYAKKDARIRVVHNSNAGVSAARNIGLDMAVGEYITFIDSDDIVEENYVFALYSNIKENHSDLSFCKMAKYAHGAIVPMPENLPLIVNLETDLSLTSFAKRFCYGKDCISSSACRILYKRNIVSEIRFDKEIRIGEDWMFVLNAVFRSKKVTSVDEVLYFYRTNESSATHSYFVNYLDNVIRINKELNRLFSRFKEMQNVLPVYSAILCYKACANEIKGAQGMRRKRIKEIRKSELYPFLKFWKMLKISGAKNRIKYLVVWCLVKFRLV